MATTMMLSSDALRRALYRRLDRNAETLSTALAVPAQESKLQVRAAYRDLHTTGVLLDRVGWRQQEAQDGIDLNGISETRVAIEALTAELEAQADTVGMSRAHGEDDAALLAEARWQAVHAALWQMEAAAANMWAPGESGGGEDAQA